MTAQLKPANPDGQAARFLRKVVLLPACRQAALITRRINCWGACTLEFAVGFNWRDRRPTLDYSIRLPWAAKLGKQSVRYDLPRTPLQARAYWAMDYFLPDAQGYDRRVRT